MLQETTFNYSSFSVAPTFDLKNFCEAKIVFKKRIIALQWSDPNDLGLSIYDPIYGYIYPNVNMNAGSNNDPYHPVEHIYYSNFVPGKKYNIYVFFQF